MPSGPSEVNGRQGSSLRFRLTFWNTGGILVLVLVLLLGIRQGLRYTLQHEMDTLLGEDVDEVRLLVERHHPHWPRIKEELDRKAVSHKARSWYARIFSAQGEVWLETIGAPAQLIPPDEAPTRPANAGGYRFLQSR